MKEEIVVIFFRVQVRVVRTAIYKESWHVDTILLEEIEPLGGGNQGIAIVIPFKKFP